MSYFAPLKQDAAKRRPCYLTPKQIAIMKALNRGNPDGSLLDIQQLIELIAPDHTRGSMVCSLRHLHAHGFVIEDDLVKRRGRKVRTMKLTDKGKQLIRPQNLPAGVSSQIVTP